MSEHSLVQEWLQIAFEDYDLAQFVYDHKHPKPLEIICFHCQQSVEKSLKGYLQARGEEVARSHEVGLLCARCAELDPSFAAHLDACNDLALYATQTRYPGRLELEGHHARHAIRWAKKIHELTVTLCETLKPIE